MWFNFGKILGALFRISLPDVLFFIPHVGAGGAEQVHLHFLDYFIKRGKTVLFVITTSGQRELFEKFNSAARVIDISSSNGRKQITLFFLGFFSTMINMSRNTPVLVSSHSYFFYRLLPFLKSSRFTVDVIHNLEPGPKMRYGSLFDSVSDSINKVTAVDGHTAELIRHYSKRQHVDVISNPTDDIFFKLARIREGIEKRAVYVGRYDPVKQPFIIEKLAAENLNWEFGWIGKVDQSKKIDEIRYYGLVKDRLKLAELMNRYDILAITSSTEAFPMAIQEAMVLGMIVVSTDVGGISTHIKHMHNGILIPSSSDHQIIHSFEQWLEDLAQNKELARNISENAIFHAKKHFKKEIFEKRLDEVFA